MERTEIIEALAAKEYEIRYWGGNILYIGDEQIVRVIASQGWEILTPEINANDIPDEIWEELLDEMR